MKTSFHKFSSLALGVLFLLAEGCTHKDLNENAHTTISDNVEVIFNWSKVPDKKASTMVLYLYSDEHGMIDYRFNNPDGDVIRTYSGRHTAVCHSNDDPYGLILRNTHSHDELEIYTDNTGILLGQGLSTKGIPRAKGTEDEPLRCTPSMLYGTHRRDINLKVSSLPQKLEFFPEELICRYRVTFENVKNLKSADLRIDATISSLAGGYFPGRMMPNSEAVSHSFTLSANLENNSLGSDFYTFGLPQGEELPHKICLYIALKNKTGGFYTFDVSDQVNKAPDPKNVDIHIVGLELPEIPDTPPYSNPDTGMSVEVDSWETYNYDLKVV